MTDIQPGIEPVLARLCGSEITTRTTSGTS